MYPYLFKGTPYEMPSWAVCQVIGFIIVVTLALIKKPKDFPVGRIQMFIAALFMMHFGFTGAKLLFMLLHWQFLMEKGYSSFSKAFSASGYAFLGALSFELLVIFAFAKFRIRRKSFLKAGDYVISFIMLHQAFSRIGCFLTGCCRGKPTDLPWGCKFVITSPTVPCHPTQIYSMLFLILIFIVTRYIYKKDWPTGVTFYSGLCMYGFFRFFVEILRIDSIQVFGTITLAQVAMLSLFAIGALAILVILLLQKY
ncbi:MAG: prolipoprotein diacylglyceryl transferase [Candidatus Omnitrophica bacterium]|nr:prolipoprotein diacylglyceryl transferase [Candidatus Omnitrophota bacterium]